MLPPPLQPRQAPPDSRPRRQVFRGLSAPAPGRWHRVYPPAAALIESERLRGAVCAFDQGGMPRLNDLSWRYVASSRHHGIHGSLPYGTKPSRDGEPTAETRYDCPSPAPRFRPPAATPWRDAQLLLPRSRVNSSGSIFGHYGCCPGTTDIAAAFMRQRAPPIRAHKCLRAACA